jgi:hypothetical protein
MAEYRPTPSVNNRAAVPTRTGLGLADLGFLPSVRRILDRTPGDGQRLLYSATLDSAAYVLVDRYLS